MNAEELRLEQSRQRTHHWKRWGPYLSERAWGTVREDYSPNGTAWEDFPHDQARSRAYRWNEDGLGGICDRHQRLCFAIAVWNGRDPILKERLFGLTGNEGNHGEDVKECYWYLDSTPTHSFLRFLYKYPQAPFPYQQLVEENRRRGKDQREFELTDTGVFDEHRYFDVFVEYAKNTPEDILIRIRVINRGPERAQLHVIPNLWFRNTWSWKPGQHKPTLEQSAGNTIAVEGERWLTFEGSPEPLFTENETNTRRLYGHGEGYFKDAFHQAIVQGERGAVNPRKRGTKAGLHYVFSLEPGEERVVELRLTNDLQPIDFNAVFEQREQEAAAFYDAVSPEVLGEEPRRVMRQAFAGLLWSKQFYHYVQRDWLQGDPGQPSPPESRRDGRNHEWPHLYNADILSMPDKWEYPWYAAWDLAFHCVPLALIDSDFAKEQLMLMLREWYMHPNGQLPAYEWAFGDVNPPVHAWAAWRVYKIEKKRRGRGDRVFLQRVFHKLLLNFTWWVNRKDAEGRNIFQGGFLGLDNIGVFDRSAPLPTGGHLEQADGSGWMAMYSLNLMAIALELAQEDPAYEDVASKFWEHFLHIAHAMRNLGLWDEDSGFFFDLLHIPHEGRELPLRIHSMVGLIPLFAVETLEPGLLEKLPGFRRRLEWFLEHRNDLTDGVTSGEGRRMLSIVQPDQLRRVLSVMLDEREFLSPYGIRALSQRHRDEPFHFTGQEVRYEPGESSTGLFGGNSNWRGPIWFPVNFLLIESLQKFHHYLGDSYMVECPTGSGRYLTLWQVAEEISQRLCHIFLPDADGHRPANDRDPRYRDDPHWRDLILFHEYFHGDTGRGVGASHQTGWTGLVAKLLQQSGAGIKDRA